MTPQKTAATLRPPRPKPVNQILPFPELNLRWDQTALKLPELTPPNQTRAIWRAKKIFADIIHDLTALEGNPFTLPEIQTLLDGITVGGRKVSDAEQVLNQKASLELLFSLVEKGTFEVTPNVALALQKLAARGEALEEGVFRSGKVGIGGTAYEPPTPLNANEMEARFLDMAATLKKLQHPFEQAMAAFLCTARTQMYWDGNKRTGRLLMNGILLTAGQDIITVPAARQLEFNQKMIRFYESGDATEMMQFLLPLQIRNRFE